MVSWSELISNIHREINSADSYASLAMEYKVCDKELSDLYVSITNNKIANVNALCSIFTKRMNAMIKEKDAENNKYADELKDMHNYLITMFAEELSRIKNIIDCVKKP